MADSLLIVDGSLRVSAAGSLVTTAGGAPCCCGGITPCECVAGPGCYDSPVSDPLGLFAGTKALGQPFAYSYGPVFVANCCCVSAESTGSAFYEFRRYFPGEGEDERHTSTATLAAGLLTVHQVIMRSLTPGGPLEVVCDQTAEYQRPPVCDVDVLGLTGPCSIPTMLLFHDDLNDVVEGQGWARRTCDVAEGYAERILTIPAGFRYTTFRWRAAIETNRTPCLTTTCRTCCLPGGTCVFATPASCLAAGGTPGNGTDCNVTICPQPIGPSACCFPDGSCENLLPFHCLRRGGVPQGINTLCVGGLCPPPPVRACCLPGGLCLDLTAAECAAQGGSWYAAQLCAAVNCTNLGACCHPDGQCSIETQGLCLSIGGVWHAGQTCAQVVCPACAGACCYTSVQGRRCSPGETMESCAALNQSTWLGCGTTCNPDPCIGPEGIWTPPRTIVVPSGCAGCGKDKERE